MTLRAEPFSPLPVEKFSGLVDKLCAHDPWWHDYIREDEQLKRQAVIAYLADAHNNGKAWEVWRDSELVGVMLLNEMTPFLDARCHFVFTDAKLGDKRDLCVSLMAHAFESVPLEVLRVELPTYAKALLKFIRKLGFRYEGEGRTLSWPHQETVLDADAARLGSRKYKATRYKGIWEDVLLLSVTRDEFVAGHKESSDGPEGQQAQSRQSA